MAAVGAVFTALFLIHCFSAVCSLEVKCSRQQQQQQQERLLLLLFNRPERASIQLAALAEVCCVDSVYPTEHTHSDR